MFDFLERGLLMEEAGDPGGTAVMDVPETTEQADGEQTEEAAETIAEEPGKGIVKDDGAQPLAPLDSKGVLAQLKTALPNLDPRLERQIKNALFTKDQFEQAVPGGLREVKAMREMIERHGGEQGLESRENTLRGFQHFDEMYVSGDPKALDFMTSDAEGQAAFLKMMPQALSKFQQLDSPAYQGYVAGVFRSTMDAYQLPLALMRLQDFMGDNPRAMEQFNTILKFYNDMGEMAKYKPEPKANVQNQDTGRMSDIEAREQKLTRDEWRRETVSSQQQVFAQKWSELAGGRKLTTEQDAAVRELFESRLGKAFRGKYEERLERYFQAGDKAGFMRMAAEIDRVEVPAALKAAFDAVMPGRPGPRPGTAPARVSKPNAQAVKGYTQVDKPPAFREVDVRQTSAEDWKRGTAIMKDGRKIQWTPK